jgi:hypothetical protein
MTKVNRVDSLTSELRDIKRRLHALETALGAVPGRTTAAARAAAAGATSAGATSAGATSAGATAAGERSAGERPAEE